MASLNNNIHPEFKTPLESSFFTLLALEVSPQGHTTSDSISVKVNPHSQECGCHHKIILTAPSPGGRRGLYAE